MRWARTAFGRGLWLVVANSLVGLTGLLAIEGAVRILVPDILPGYTDERLITPNKYGETYGYTPNTTGWVVGREFVTDWRGFRIDPQQRLQPKPKSMLLMGDSVISGVCEAAPNIFPVLLEDRVASHRVRNASVMGYTIENYVQALKHILPAVKPDGVLLGLCLNDFSSTSQRQIVETDSDRQEDWKQRYPNPLVRWAKSIDKHVLPFHAYLNRYSHAYLWLKQVAADTQRDYFVADLAAYTRPRAEDHLRAALTQVVETVRAHQKWLEVVIFPYEYQLREPGEEALLPQRQIRQILHELDVPLYDIFPDLQEELTQRGLTSKALYCYNDPMHFSAIGHKIVAQLLQSELTRRGRLH